MSFSNSSVIVVTNTGSVHSFETNQSSPYSVTFPAGSTGIWTWLVSRAGYSCQSGTIDASMGGLYSASPAPTLRLQPNGSAMYQATSDANLSISFDLTTPGSERCFIDIGNGSVGVQAIIDEIELALETQDGCRFLAATNCSECSIAELAAGDFLFMGTGYRIRRASAGDVNATVEAFVISSDGVVVDGINGGVNFLSANMTAADVASAVWDEATSGHTTAGTFGKIFDLWKKSNPTVEGQTTGTPTTTVIQTNLSAVNGIYDHLLLIITNGALEGEARPILSYSQTNGTITLQEPLSAAPASGVDFIIVPQHIHPISEIQDGLGTKQDLIIINEGVKKASIMVPHNTNLT